MDFILDSSTAAMPVCKTYPTNYITRPELLTTITNASTVVLADKCTGSLEM